MAIEETKRGQKKDDELLMAQAQSNSEIKRQRTLSVENIARALAQDKLATGTIKPKVVWCVPPQVQCPSKRLQTQRPLI